MQVKTSFLIIAALLSCHVPARAQRPTAADAETSAATPGRFGSALPARPSLEFEQLSSPSVSGRFYDLARELAGPKNVTGPRLEQAIAFLTAAINLDPDNKAARPLLIELACRRPEPDRSSFVYALLADYVDESADLDIAGKAVAYLLEQVNSREQREELLEQMLETLAGGNNVLSSRLATMLGTLKAEKADRSAAEFYFLQAYKANRYNRLAFAKLGEVAPAQIGPAVSLERLRLALRENPSEIEAAVAFASYAEKLQLYELAAAAYEYCADLYRYLYESEAIPARIYIPWALSNYNTQADQAKCLQIARRVRQESGFDLRIEAIAGRAAIKMGDVKQAGKIFQDAEKNAQLLISSPGPTSPGAIDAESSQVTRSQQTYMEQLAWFYCFALPMPAEAVKWANKAFAIENSPVTSSILAYALATDNQTEWAKPLIDKDNLNQIAELTHAMIQLAESQTDQATESLESAIAKDPGSFAAERAKMILVEQGEGYVPPIDPNELLASLENAFGRELAPVFTPPEQVISARLDVQGDTFEYGADFSGIVAITNNSTEPFIVSDEGLFKGNIRIDAEITGDLRMSIPSLAFTRNRTTFLAAPGRSIIIPVRLNTGELRRTLMTHPQASLDVEFTLYLDPVMTEGGRIANRLTHVQPARTRIRRPGIRLEAKYLRDRFKSISTSRPEEKIQTAQLFTGLLAEQQASSDGRLTYAFMSADWVAPLLRNALVHESGLLRSRADADWVVKVHTMTEMLSLPLDFKLTNAAAENLNDTKWPVRMTAVYLLAKSPAGKFGRVLNATAGNDPSKFVRDMAIALSGTSASGQTERLQRQNGP
ncbi:MAG: tetratricopeptide repeat protein [Planctomycetota bacterium]